MRFWGHEAVKDEAQMVVRVSVTCCLLALVRFPPGAKPAVAERMDDVHVARSLSVFSPSR
jgi:hypothetical protein